MSVKYLLLLASSAFAIPCDVQTVSPTAIAVVCPDVPSEILYFHRFSKEEWAAFLAARTPPPQDTTTRK